MNRSLLIVICDFLILSLLSLASFDRSPTEQEPTSEAIAEVESVADASPDLIEALRISLEEEQASRLEISGDLDQVQDELRKREEALAEREARLQELAASLEQRDSRLQELAVTLEERDADARQLERDRAALEQRVAETEAEKAALAEARAKQEAEAQLARDEVAARDRELREKLAELAEAEQRLAQLAEKQQEAEEMNRQLATQLQLSETEKQLVREHLEQVRNEVLIVREEKDRIQEQAGQLAQGVSALAEQSGELVQEVRRSQPKTANTLFSDFQANQLQATFRRNRPLFLREREEETRTILVSDGERTFALFHIEHTGLNLREAADWSMLSARLTSARQAGRIQRLSFLAADPRILAVEIGRGTADQFGVEVYQLAKEPFRFSEAVLIGNSGTYYGESSFTLDAENRRYLQMDRRIITRLFGEFSPSRGDFVFSKTGELLGIMVNNEYCALIENLEMDAGRFLFMGENLTGVGDLLWGVRQEIDRLPGRFR